MSENKTHLFSNLKQMFELALTSAKASPDKRLRVGAVITDSDFNLISVGYNAKPNSSSSYHDCVDPRTNKSAPDLLHAEVRAVIAAGKKATKDAIMFVTHCPCERCAGVIAEAGIRTVYFLENHDDGAGAILLSNEYGITVKQVMNIRRSIDERIRQFDLTDTSDDDLDSTLSGSKLLD